LNFVGLHIPVGRLYAEDMFDLARIAEVYGTGELRFTVEQNLIIPNILALAYSHFKRTSIRAFFRRSRQLNPGLVSCTGSQFCGFALIETKTVPWL
jgi:ferredoxin-nitrite reductase